VDGRNSQAARPADDAAGKPIDDPASGSDKPRGALAAVLVLAASVRIIAAWRSVVVFDDGPIFIYVAEAMAAGNWTAVLQHPYHPLYSVGVWLGGAVLGDYETAAVALSIVSGTVAVALLYGLLRDAFDLRTGLIGAAILAVHPRAVLFTSDVQSDSLYMALFLAGLFLIGRLVFASEGRSTRSTAGLVAATGVVIGAAYLTRPEGIGLAVVAAAVGGVMLWSGRWRWNSGILLSAALCLGLGLAIAPYVLALRAETGAWMLSQKKSVAELLGFARHDPGPNAVWVAAARARPLSQPRIATPSALPRATDRPPPSPDRSTPERIFDALHVMGDATLSGFRYDMLLLMVLGIASCRGVPGSRGWLFGGVAVIYLVVLVALALNAGYVSRRHALTPLIPLFGYAALGVPVAGRILLSGGSKLRGLLGLSPPSQAVGAGVVTASDERWSTLLGLSVVVALALPSDLAARRSDRLAVRQAAEWLQAAKEAPLAVATGRLRIAYYAGGRFVPLPSAPKEGMMSYLRAREAGYVIVDEAKVGQHTGLRAAQAEGLRLIHRETVEGRSAAVFEVTPAG